jgi:hypothetical protein
MRAALKGQLACALAASVQSPGGKRASIVADLQYKLDMLR